MKKKVCALLCGLALILGVCYINTNDYGIPAAEDLFVYTGEIDSHRYYFNQLSDIEKELYKRLEANKENFINNVESTWITADEIDQTGLTYESLQKAFEAYQLDSPLANIWLYDLSITFENGDCIFKLPEDCKTFGVFENAEQTLNALDEIKTAATKFVETLHGTDEEKHRQIYSFLSSGSLFADEEDFIDNKRPLTVHTAYSCLIDSEFFIKHSVCDGFSRSYKYIADLAGLKALLVFGISNQNDYMINLDNAIQNQDIFQKITKQKPFVPNNHAWILIWTEPSGWTVGDINWENHFHTTIFIKTGEEPIFNEAGNLIGWKGIFEKYPETSYTFFMKDIIEDFNEGNHIPCELFMYPSSP